MTPPNQPRIRANKKKTRTGCRTCKLRKVKCDEGKPFCVRCLNFGADCGGYEPDPYGPKKNARQGNLREILPRTSHHQLFLSPLVGRLPFTAFFQDNREYSYFLYFQDETALDLSGPFDANLFNHVVLQASQNEPSLCQLISSVGALNKATRLRALNHPEEADSHQQYAFRQYGRALKGIQAMISANQHQDATRIALIAALLIYCFENLHGELDSAITHIESALQLMHKQLAKASRRYKHLENTSPTSALEGCLVAAFVRLDNGLLSRADNDKSENIGWGIVRSSILDINYSEDIYEVPDRFNDIFEARNYLEHFQFRALPSLSHEFAVAVQLSESPGTMDELARDMYRRMSSQLRQWSVAFAPLYAETLTPNGNKNFIAAATLRVRALSTELAAQRVCARGLSSSDLFIAESREIVDLSRYIAADPSFLKSFVLDCGIVPGLFIVVVACPDMNIQKEALQILRQTQPRQEGAWDSLTLVKIGERHLQMDEGGD